MDNAFARSLRRVPHHMARGPRDSLSQPSSPVVDMELGSMGEHFNGQEDHKAFRREEFEGKLRDMGLELEKDEDVSLHLFMCSYRKVQ